MKREREKKKKIITKSPGSNPHRKLARQEETDVKKHGDLTEQKQIKKGDFSPRIFHQDSQAAFTRKKKKKRKRKSAGGSEVSTDLQQIKKKETTDASIYS